MSLFESIGILLAGVSIFLLGMSFMEETLGSLGGRTFKLFLRKQTSNKYKAVAGGTVVTGLLQSSSVVNLLILSLVGANIIQLQNALAVTLGANFGTTLDSWIVASLGFKFDINRIVYPIGGIAGISLAFFSSHKRYYLWCKFLLGFSFLFIGLGFIKDGMGDFINNVEVEKFSNLPPIAFFGMGLLLTAIIQSSSTTIALTLSALYSNAISLPAGMAVILGSEIGTTLKLFLASAKGVVVKKQLALGNFSINLIIGILGMFLLSPLHKLTMLVVGSEEKLFGLVFFQSLMNVVGILLFFPFLNAFAKFLSHRFQKKERDTFISSVSPDENLLAGEALEKETVYFLRHILFMGYKIFEGRDLSSFKIENENFETGNETEMYNYIKTYHGEIHTFYSKLQATNTDRQGVERYEQLAAAVRNGMYAAKNLKDAFSDIDQLKNSSNDIKYKYYLQAQKTFLSFIEESLSILNEQSSTNTSEKLFGIFRKVQESYNREINNLYQNKGITDLQEAEISTILNFNREIFTCYKSIIFAIKDAVLTGNQGSQFEELPGFIR